MYRFSGVKEYWVVNPMKQIITVFDLKSGLGSSQMSFDEEIASLLYPGLVIRISELI